MYNRILKRPMFKRGGSSYQSQGTGITSPYDTPRTKYNVGTTWEDINERRSNIFQPRSEMDFAAEGFSALGDPYKERTGEAKTIGEMLYEGAGQVRKSRAADKALGQSVELANIESDASRLLAEEKHARDLEIVAANAKSQLNKDYSIKRQVLDLTKQLNKQAENQAYEGAEFINDGFAQSIAQGTVEINENGYHAMVVPMSAIKRTEGVWRINKDILAPGMVYWNPINQQWLIVQNARTKNATPIHYGSYAEAKAGLKVTNTEEGSSTSGADSTSSDASDTEIKNNEIKMKIVTNLKDVDINDKSVIYDEAQKVGIKIVENTEGSKQFIKNLADNEMTLFTFTEILKKKKMSDTYGHVSSSKAKRGDVFDQVTEEIKLTEKMAGGGRAGYASGTEPDDDLSELTSWWKSEVDNSFNS